MATDQCSGFPKFSDGDVIVVVSPARFYRLHSSILRRNSGFFAKQFETVQPAKLTPYARRERHAPYHFELVQQSSNTIGTFVCKEVTPQGRVAKTDTTALNILDTARTTSASNDEQFRHWDWLFGTFYNQQPAFDDHNLATVLSGCMGLVDVAESIQAVDQIREFVDLALLRQDKTLWDSVASNPTAWAELGRRVHSHMIFKEGICHMVGRWGAMSNDPAKNDLHADIQTLCQKKADELELVKEAAELRILGHYPTFLWRDAAARPTRPSYSNDIYMWMSVCFYRQWFAQAISHDRTRRAKDGGFAFYTAVAKGGQNYLVHEDFSEFHRYFPMSSKACNVLETNMSILKEEVKGFVKELVTNRCHVLDTEAHGIDWLTCAVVGKKECPWYVPGEGDEDDDDDDEDDLDGTGHDSFGAGGMIVDGPNKFDMGEYPSEDTDADVDADNQNEDDKGMCLT